MMPLTYVKITGIDYLERIGLFCIGLWLCYYINKLFLIKLDETAEKMKLQELITRISSDCVGINQQNFTENIDYLLKTSCEFFAVDRTYICLFDQEEKTFSCSAQSNLHAAKAAAEQIAQCFRCQCSLYHIVRALSSCFSSCLWGRSWSVFRSRREHLTA